MPKNNNQDKSKPISPSARTKNQKHYIKALQNLDIVICYGPPGTGKTRLAVGQGVYYLKTNFVDKLVITRPAVEAGERIGFLPGDIAQKMDPFVTPIFHELNEFLYPSEIEALIQLKKIEICPIGFMRGITFKNSYIISDESQNLTFDQMKMLLTRFGENSKMVINGDIDQSDLEHHKRGAFQFICELFKDNDEIGVVKLDTEDIQRHRLVGKIVKKWEKHVDLFKKNGKIEREEILEP